MEERVAGPASRAGRGKELAAAATAAVVAAPASAAAAAAQDDDDQDDPQAAAAKATAVIAPHMKYLLVIVGDGAALPPGRLKPYYAPRREGCH